MALVLVVVVAMEMVVAVEVVDMDTATRGVARMGMVKFKTRGAHPTGRMAGSGVRASVPVISPPRYTRCRP